MKFARDNIKKILVVRPDAIGDLVLITPAIAALRQSFPQAHIAVLLKASTAPVAEFNPDIDEIIIDQLKSGRIKNLRDYFNYVKEIKQKHFDLSIDFYSFSWQHALLLLLAGIPRRLGDKSRLLLAPFYNLGKVLKYKDYTKHIVDLHLDLIKTIGVEAKEPRLKLELPAKTQNDFQQKLAGLGIAPEDFLVGIHPGCISSRAWDEDRFALVIEGLQNKFQAEVVLTGGPQERAKGEKISSLCRQRPINLIEKTTIPEMMALIKRLNIYIGADTGPTHIAAALGTPVLLIILGKNVKPVRWASYNSQHLIIYAHPQAKCPLYCDSGRCKEIYCSRAITPEIVLSAVQQLKAGKSHDRFDWQRLSLNVCLIFDQANKARAEKVALELDKKGFHAVLFESKDLVGIRGIKRLLRTIETENILVLHQSGKKHAGWARLANLLSGIYTTNATVLAKGYTENEDLLKKYSATFQKSLF